MKRVICISVLSAFVFSLLLAFAIVWLQSASVGLDYLHKHNIEDSAEINDVYSVLRNGLLFIFGALCTLALYALYAVKEFKVFQPYVERYKARKAERAATRKEKALSDKERRLQELQSELDEMKKDE